MARGRVVCLVCLLFLINLSTAAEVRAQAGTIQIFGDAALTSCHIIDNGPAAVPVYVAHKFSSPALGVRFMIDYSGTTMTKIGETSPHTWMGDSGSGVTICYGACLPGPSILVLTVTFFGSGTTPTCTLISVQPHLEDGQILALDCSWNLMFPTGGAAYVNSDGSCTCHAGPDSEDEIDGANEPEDHFCAWVPVEKTTWGQIKSMYE